MRQTSSDLRLLYAGHYSLLFILLMAGLLLTAQRIITNPRFIESNFRSNHGFKRCANVIFLLISRINNRLILRKLEIFGI